MKPSALRIRKTQKSGSSRRTWIRRSPAVRSNGSATGELQKSSRACAANEKSPKQCTVSGTCLTLRRSVLLLLVFQSVCRESLTPPESPCAPHASCILRADAQRVDHSTSPMLSRKSIHPPCSLWQRVRSRSAILTNSLPSHTPPYPPR